MSLIDNVIQFNGLQANLPALQGFIGIVQAGRITIETNGIGHYWARVPQHNTDTGIVTDIIIPLNITTNLSIAQDAISALLPYIQGAAVVNSPPDGAIVS